MAINLNHSSNKISTEQDLTLDANEKVSVSDNRVVDLSDPIDDTDAVNKRYVLANIVSNISSAEFKYTNNAPMPEEVGGYEIGDTFTDATLEQLFTNLLYPYQYPTVSSFSISGQPTILEVGDSVTGGNRTFSWNFTNDVNIAANTVKVEDVTTGTVFGQTYANDDNQTIDIGIDITKPTSSTHTWKISANNTKNQTISRNFNVNWRWRTFYGTSANESLTDTEVQALVSTSLDSNFTGNKTVGGGGYKYFAYPTVFGQKKTFQDVVNGFAVAMQPPSVISITNSFGISQDYYVHRTTNPIVGSLTVAIS